MRSQEFIRSLLVYPFIPIFVLSLIRPSYAVAVLAFKTVYKLEMTRRENDRRIQALYVEMKDMMAVLIQSVSLHS